MLPGAAITNPYGINAFANIAPATANWKLIQRVKEVAIIDGPGNFMKKVK
jgi:hypothetical protein